MMAHSTDRVQRSFSRSFDTYHQAAGPQGRIAERLVTDLRDCGAPGHFSSVLELGCGTGLLTQKLREAFVIGDLTLNDLAPEAGMTAQTAAATFLCGDALQVDWPDRPDLITSASMIQWLADPAALLRRAADALAPGGWLAVSGFGPKQYHELAQIGSSAGAPGLCRSEDLAASVQTEMELVTSGEHVQQLHFASPRLALKHLRQTGVNGRAKQFWTKSDLLQFSTDYTRRFGTDAGVPLTYHSVWIVARKPV